MDSKDSMDRDVLAFLSKDELIDVVLAQGSRLAEFELRLGELERRLGLNSGKPPSSDGLNKPPAGKKKRTRSLRKKSARKPGGQKGHKGETLRQVADPDATVDHYPETCQWCGSGLTPDMATGHGARQVFDLPEPRPLVVTEHRAHRCRCGHCGTYTRASFPVAITGPVQYGARIGAMVVYLSHYQLLPEDRLAELMKDLFGAELSPASLARMGGNSAESVQGVVDVIRELVKSAPVKHMDETGLRIAGRTQWLHVASTARLTFYRVSERRGSLLGGVGGIVVHDHWKPYFTMEGVRHALCNAHHLRELQALIEIEKEGWARKMQRLLRRACHAVNLARERGVALKPGLVERFRVVLRRDHGRGHRLSRGTTSSCAQIEQGQAPGKQAAPHRAQPSPAPSDTQGRRAALPHQFRRAVHQQSGRAGRAHDEGQAENLRRLPPPERRRPAIWTTYLRLVISTARKQGSNIIQALNGKSRKPDRASPRRRNKATHVQWARIEQKS